MLNSNSNPAYVCLRDCSQRDGGAAAGPAGLATEILTKLQAPTDGLQTLSIGQHGATYFFKAVRTAEGLRWKFSGLLVGSEQ